MVTVKELVDEMTEKRAISNTFASSPKRFANSSAICLQTELRYKALHM